MTSALNYIILTTDGSTADDSLSLVCNELVPTTGFPIRLVVASPFEILEATAGSSYTLTITRGEEGTSGVVIPTGTVVVCELTHETLEDIYDSILLSEKIIGNNEIYSAMDAREPDVNEITVDTTNNKVMVGVDAATNTWEELAPESHADLDDIATSTLHTQYYTETRGDTWHGEIVPTHLTTLDHDHLTVPVANIRDLATEPADTTTGGVYYNTTSRTFYYYDGANWQPYNTVPPHAIIFKDDGSCPFGWTEKTSWNGRFLKGDDTGTWAGGSGGSSTHTHLLSEVPAHAHTITDRAVTISSVGQHYHNVGGAGTSSGSNIGAAYNTAQTISMAANDSGHSHSIVVPQHNTSSSGTSGAETQSSTGLPKYVELTMCEKN